MGFWSQKFWIHSLPNNWSEPLSARLNVPIYKMGILLPSISKNCREDEIALGGWEVAWCSRSETWVWTVDVLCHTHKQMKTVTINYLRQSNLFKASKWVSRVLLRRRSCTQLSSPLTLQVSRWWCREMGRRRWAKLVWHLCPQMAVRSQSGCCHAQHPWNTPWPRHCWAPRALSNLSLSASKQKHISSQLCRSKRNACTRMHVSLCQLPLWGSAPSQSPGVRTGSQDNTPDNTPAPAPGQLLQAPEDLVLGRRLQSRALGVVKPEHIFWISSSESKDTAGGTQRPHSISSVSSCCLTGRWAENEKGPQVGTCFIKKIERIAGLFKI